jgi:hypothetical protein
MNELTTMILRVFRAWFALFIMSPDRHYLVRQLVITSQ